jgi:hypothetical protein
MAKQEGLTCPLCGIVSRKQEHKDAHLLFHAADITRDLLRLDPNLEIVNSKIINAKRELKYLKDEIEYRTMPEQDAIEYRKRSQEEELEYYRGA